MRHAPLRFLAGLVLACAAGVTSAGEFMALKIRVSASGHELIGARRFSAPQVEAGAWTAPSDRQLDWQLLGEHGQVLAQGAVADPRVARGPLVAGQGHALIVRPAAEYILRVPAVARASTLQLQPLARAGAGQAGRPRAVQAPGETAGVPLQKIDLRAVMRPTR
ncbi:MAG: hypothetical protein EOP39_27450 [Rubrivivax sp.]|nr:MAG: hypothetical protein EOP39_27450 [Rubrivivax sp.]